MFKFVLFSFLSRYDKGGDGVSLDSSKIMYIKKKKKKL
jgi:hypothetical protein